ncbi:uncharacterized protein LOC111262481 [Varroa jacobsoni]|uniref:Uncharacterized protein n=1 Tax=Varroa destructor TaxID=109461 RepID=A0A7M7K159_VARDE|nr:uncharacterized protein LOC111249581 [Varroa destructor]XP_022659333.1 uncharacterized protein LOC111249581 [Varroa destructor]XP_022692510.1 uncharacterized protein LOC111262481 [Varroa jacobsoni]XP_022692511.1 uncharacterized protein LOC111262481 [Varroa jacobsoni]XP_022692512.1 uncharacterized protein LOC111262481 [Varroa jacobsoni]
MTGLKVAKGGSKTYTSVKVPKKKSFETVPLNYENETVTQYLTAKSEPDTCCRESPGYTRYREREPPRLDERWAVILAVIFLGAVVTGIMLVAYYQPYLGIKE